MIQGSAIVGSARTGMTGSGSRKTIVGGLQPSWHWPGPHAAPQALRPLYGTIRGPVIRTPGAQRHGSADGRGGRVRWRRFCGLAERRSAVTAGRGHQQLPVPPWQPCRAKHVPPNNVYLIADATLPRNHNGDRWRRERRARSCRRYLWLAITGILTAFTLPLDETLTGGG